MLHVQEQTVQVVHSEQPLVIHAAVSCLQAPHVLHVQAAQITQITQAMLVPLVPHAVHAMRAQHAMLQAMHAVCILAGVR